ncbi:MAG TPA: hypothetical protein ENK91_06195 [Bacteroidetes bacterium]|nr:hypothetical protein [Bacteroidota bacterium]
MKNIFKLILLILTVTLLTGCCLEDHRPTIRKVAEPVFKELEIFYKQNNRYPTAKEQITMLKQVGCKMDGDICKFEGNELKVTRIEKTYVGDYRLIIQVIDKKEINIRKQSLATCSFGIYEDGTLNGVGCSKRACIELRQ